MVADLGEDALTVFSGFLTIFLSLVLASVLPAGFLAGRLVSGSPAGVGACVAGPIAPGSSLRPITSPLNTQTLIPITPYVVFASDTP